MQKSTIKAISKSETINYGDKKINDFWLKVNDRKIIKDNNNLERINTVFKQVENSVICIQTEEINHADIIKAIYEASKHNNRIYLLTNNKDTDLKKLEGVCLIRYGIKNIGSFILINPNTNSEKGILFSAPLIESSFTNVDNFVLDIDSQQTQTLFRFFSDNFWNNTQFEIIESFDTAQEVPEAPLDFLPNINDFCDRDYVTNQMSKINSETIISVPQILKSKQLNPNLTNSKILSSFKNEDFELLKKLALNNNTIVATIQNNLNFVINNNGESWLIPKSSISDDDNFFALKLNNSQVDILGEYALSKIDIAEFQFELSKTRKELENNKIHLITDLDNELGIKPTSNINCNDIKLDSFISKEDFEKTKPSFTDDAVSVTIDYTWNIIPFTKPANAKKAILYSQWEIYQKDYISFLEKIKEAINESETIKVSDKLKRFFLGKNQTLFKYKRELEQLETKCLFQLSVNDRNDIIDVVNTLATNVDVNLSEINIEIEKSKIDEEVEALKSEKIDKKKELANFIEEHDKKTKDKEAKKQEDLKCFLDKNNIDENDLTLFKTKLIQQSGKKNKNKNPEEFKLSNELLSELKEINGIDFSSKFNADSKKFQKEIENLDRRVIKLEKELTKVNSSSKLNEGSSINYAVGNANKSTNKYVEAKFNIPHNIESLPEIGVLYEVGKQKYLDIEFWEDYELGLKEMKRFNAKLSAQSN
jgi:hypothetical protein